MIGRRGWLVGAVLICRLSGAEPSSLTPPAGLIAGEPIRGAALEAVFAHFKVDRLACKFSEQKHVALLAKPLRSSGVLIFDRSNGVARKTTVPKVGQVVVTRAAVRIADGRGVETIPLAKSKELRAFAMIFPAVLRGDRTELETSFDIGLYGTERAWWALVFTPRSDSLKAIVTRVIVFGRRSDIAAVQVVEASGDRTDTQLSDIVTNAGVSDAAIAAGFGDT